MMIMFIGMNNIKAVTDDEYFACSLCSNCLKLRPTCKYCNELVDEVDEEEETNKKFENNHWMCIQNNHTKNLDLGWRKYADIDWDKLQKWTRNKYIQLFQEISKLDYKKHEVNLVVVTGINGGLSFNVQEIISNSEIISLTDMVDDWFDINDTIIETFSCLDHELDIDDEESEKDYHNILERIKSIIIEEFLVYKDANFKFNKNINVKWELYES